MMRSASPTGEVSVDSLLPEPAQNRRMTATDGRPHYTSRPLAADPQLPGHGEGAAGPYLRAVRAHARVVAAIVLASLLGAIAWLALRSPDYEATAQILVSALPQDDDTFLGTSLTRDTGDPTNTVQTAATLVESTAAATRTARLMGKGWDSTRVLDVIAIEPEGESNIIAVTGTAESGPTAARLANTFARSALVARQAELRRQVTGLIQGLRARQARVAGVGGE